MKDEATTEESSPDTVQCIGFKPSGKYYTVYELDMSGMDEEYDTPEAVKLALTRAGLSWGSISNVHLRCN